MMRSLHDSAVKTIIWFPFSVLRSLWEVVQAFVQNAGIIESLLRVSFSLQPFAFFDFAQLRRMRLHQNFALTFMNALLTLHHVDGRKGWHNNTEPVRSRLSDQPGGATRRATKPEKTDGSARCSRGLELRKQ